MKGVDVSRSVYLSLARRDVLLVVRNLADVLQPLVFVLLLMVMFPLALGSSAQLLSQVAPGLVWMAVLLAVLLSLDGLFRADVQDGFVAQWLTHGRSLTGYALVRMLTHYALQVLPLVLLSPLLALALYLPLAVVPVLLLAVLLGTGVMVAVGAIAVALTAAMPKGGLLLALLVLPFYVPVLVFGASAVSVAADGLSPAGQLYVLAALWVLSLVLSPLATAAALKMSVSES